MSAEAIWPRVRAFASLAVDLQGRTEYVDEIDAGIDVAPPGQDALDALFEIFRQLQESEAS
jgi:hypothetical protein